MSVACFPHVTIPKAPPIKSQGIKTRLVPFIFSSFVWDGRGTWIEPFFGTGAVAFNARPKRVLAADTNRHLIGFYEAVKSGKITPRIARRYLENEGRALLERGAGHYYSIRDRFNKEGDPLDFLFLNRSCFNGVIRFNRKGEFNVPFCRKPDRFRQAYITKIVNQVEWISQIIRSGDWTFAVLDWKPVVSSAQPGDFVYLDPPYVGRHTDYFDSWSEADADALAEALRSLKCGFVYSMWYRNRYRVNDHLMRWFSDYPIFVQRYFYHVGPTENLRNEMEEALVVSRCHAREGGPLLSSREAGAIEHGPAPDAASGP